MSQRRAVYAARFLRPPGWTKRLLLREKPRELTGPYENPVRRWVRLREKARQFSELPPPRKVPVPKPTKKKFLQAVEGVPRVSPAVLQLRLDFLLSEKAVEQQLAAPLRPGLSPYYVEFTCWERQMREIRRIYRAQYLQKLAEVTEIERAREEELHRKALEERQRRKQAHLQRVGEDMKRRAILKDRKRIEAKVNEAIEMARRSKLKRRKIYWFRRVENLSKIIATADNLNEALAPPVGSGTTAGFGGKDSKDEGPLTASGLFLSRNVSVPFLLRQLGGAKTFPKQKSHRIPHVENVFREVLEESYELLPEDAERFEPPAPEAPSHRQRAAQLYGGFTKEEKLKLLDQKIEMLRAKLSSEERVGIGDQITKRLLDELMAVKLAMREDELQAPQRAAARAARGEDPRGLPPRTTGGAGTGPSEGAGASS